MEKIQIKVEKIHRKQMVKINFKKLKNRERGKQKFRIKVKKLVEENVKEKEK